MNRRDDDASPQVPEPSRPTHREMYPEQYADPLCGLRVRVENATDEAGTPIRGTVVRVVPSRFGRLAILAEYGAEQAWPAADCTPVDCYTLDGVEVTLAEFLEANPDLEPEEVQAIHDLQPGQEIAFGGGATALSILRRERPGWPGESPTNAGNEEKTDL